MSILSVILLATAAWSAKWIGPAPETRPDMDWGAAQWITASADAEGTVTLKTTLDGDGLAADEAVIFVHAGEAEREITVNGTLAYKPSGHVWDPRYPVMQNLRPWLKAGRNELTVSLRGKGDKAFLARIDGARTCQTDGTWTAAHGKVRELGGVRETAFGKTLKLRTETLSPAFAKTFAVGRGLRSATLRITGVGFYEALLNGTKIGDAVLEPTPTKYDKRVLYATHELKPTLREGENELVILLGHGWYDNRSVATWNFESAPWRDFPRTIAQLDLVYEDGRRETVGTDASWRQVTNPVVYDDIYEGEILDGRLVAGAPIKGRGLAAVEVAGPNGRLEPAHHPSARIRERIRATAVHPLADGSCMIEFPVNVVGWIRLALNGQKAGDVVSFRYDERVNADFTPAADSVCDGLHDRGAPPSEPRMVDEHFRFPGSYRFCAKDAAFQCDRYFCRGEDGEIFEPRFSYKGFRYVWAKGLARLPKADQIEACFVQTDFPKIGSFACSDETFNRLMAMGERAYRSNFTDGIPTDCPHREKNGWTGDASIASELAQYVFENTATYENWLRSIIDEQLPSGDFPCIIPSSGWGFAWGNGPAWDSALPVIAWNLWLYRDDRKILDEVYPALRRYLAFTATKADANGLVRHGLGDWVTVDIKLLPAEEYTSTCYYYQAQRIAAEMAKVLGHADEARAYEASAARTREGVRRKYRKADGTWANGGQTAQAMALAFGLVDAGERAAVEAKLVESVVRADNHIAMGLLGTKHVFRALSRMGRTDLAFKMLTIPTFPSPAFWALKGESTLWENWKGGGSRNHIMFGDFVGWAYQYLAGISLPETADSCSAVMKVSDRGFKKVVFAPCVIDALTNVAASVKTPVGTYASSWTCTDGRVTYRFSVPAGGSAVIRLPGRADETVGAGVYERTLTPRDPARPLVVMRLTDSPVRKPDFFRASCRVHAKYRGAFDECWYGGGKPLCKVDVSREELKAFAALRPAVEASGMTLSYQQGLTIGHDYEYVGKPGTQEAAGVYAAEEAEPFPDDAWMVRPNGEVAKRRCLCPRSPAVLDYERRYVKAVLEEIRPASYWLDDDLRLGVNKVGCFCPRCLAAFGRQIGTNVTREELVERLFKGRELDPIRLEWIKFVEESLAIYGRAARAGADEVMPACRLSLQTVGSTCLLNGRDYGPILRALSGDGRMPAGIRPGHGHYTEAPAMELLGKALWVTREAERCRRLGAVCGTVCYEQETYTRRVLHKSPGAIVTESALALASGCDTVSLYWADGEPDERIEDYERFVRAVARARPYFERLSASTLRTSLGGVARYLGAKAYEQKGFDLDDAADVALARCGIPVTVAEATASDKVWLVTPKSRAAMTDADWEGLKKSGWLEVAAEPYPTVKLRTAWLDQIDRLTEGRFPVRIDLPHALRVLPRVLPDGTVDSVTLLNLSIGDVEDLKVRIRRPAGAGAVLMDAKGDAAKPIASERGASADEVVVTVPNLPGWQIATIFFGNNN